MAQEKPAVRGPVTGQRLDDISCLMLPLARDPFGRLRPPLCADALRLSLELCDMTYRLAPQPWLRAGWTDLSLQVDNQVLVGVSDADDDGDGLSAVGAWKLRWARGELRERNPVSLLRGALRQREGSDTVKAVVMLRPDELGRFVVAIGFMGTGSRVFDWFSNFRFTTEEGFHQGFYQLARHFEQSAEQMLFPTAAAVLGVEKLTLSDIFAELKRPQSRFRLWMAGHSQGGAVMQVFTHFLLHEWGALPQNVVGYGFASPTVAGGSPDIQPAAYPLYHLINSDDVVPRVGALCHLGVGLLYQSGDSIRETAYGLDGAEEAARVREDVRLLMLRMRDTPTAMETVVAFLQVFAEEKAEDFLDELQDRRWSVRPVDRLLEAAGNKTRTLVQAVTRYTERGYFDLTGTKPDEGLLSSLREQMMPVVRRYTVAQLKQALGELVRPPHVITRAQGRLMGAYAYIALRGLSALRPFVWETHADARPTRHFADAPRWTEPPRADAAVVQAPRARHMPALRRAVPAGKRRLGLSARRR